MNSLRRVPARTRIGTVAAAVAFAFAAFGLSSCGGGGTSATEGGEVRLLTPSFTDYQDPQLGYEATGWEARYNVYIPLLTFAHAESTAGTQVIPGLAKDLPAVSKDGLTYTLFLTQGLKYSDGTDVKASDFKFAVERMFDVDSGGAGFYTDIVGAADYQAGKANDISGIQTDDKTGKIVVKLAPGATRGTFNDELALQFVAPVPQDTPPKDQTADPPPATGPYYFTKVVPGQSWVEERNPYWEKNNAKLLPDLPSGHVDKITSTVVKNFSSAVTEIEQNKADDLTDPPPTDRLQEVESKYSDRYKPQPNIDTYYFWMNTQQPPFDDPKVRQAVNYAVDRTALQRIYGGLMTPTENILPPGMPGYQKFDPPLYPHDLDKAKQLLQQANPSDTDITVWTDADPPNDKAGEYYQSVLKDIGFNAKLKILNGSVYFDVIGSDKTPDLDTGWSDWFQDYPHPNDFLDILLNGDNITPVHNNNYALYDDPKINDEITKLGHEVQFSDTVESQYAALDKTIMEQAPWVPYGNRQLATFVSDRMDFGAIIYHPVFEEDFTSWQLTK
jgi:peptide/nickel transport system substrate-binding protein